MLSSYNLKFVLYVLIKIVIYAKVINYIFFICRASLVAQLVKNLPEMGENWVQSLSWDDPLEKEMATHSSTLAWKIPWTEEPAIPWSRKESDVIE